MAIVTGTESGETLSGTSGDDQISALGGNDVINLSKGVDTVDGGAGDDRLNANSGTINLPVGPRTYTLTASRLFDGSGQLDTSFANIERVSFADQSGYDVTFNAAAFTGLSLSLLVGAGSHSLTGGAQADSFTVSLGSAAVDGGAGADSLTVMAETWFDAPLTITRSAGSVLLQAGTQSVTADNIESLAVYASGSSSLIADASQFDMAVTFLSSLYGDIVVGSSAADNFVHFGANDELAGIITRSDLCTPVVSSDNDAPGLTL